jgi:hypothetical protein
MTIGPRTRITIERERILVLARKQSARGWCERCGSEVEFVNQKQVGSFMEGFSGQWRESIQADLHQRQAKDKVVVRLKTMLRLLRAAGSR